VNQNPIWKILRGLKTMTDESSNQAARNTNQYQEEIIAHWNGRSREYDSRPHHGLQSQLEKEVWLETLRSLLPQAPADVLDVGTGTGFLALLLAGWDTELLV
jgi:protein-L-isoaspartate O-methyltransferase